VARGVSDNRAMTVSETPAQPSAEIEAAVYDDAAGLWPLSESYEYAAEVGAQLAALLPHEELSFRRQASPDLLSLAQAYHYAFLRHLEEQRGEELLPFVVTALAQLSAAARLELIASREQQLRDWSEQLGPPAAELAGEAVLLYRSPLPEQSDSYGELGPWTAVALAGADAEEARWEAAPRAALEAVHATSYLEGLAFERATPVALGPETYAYPQTLELAQRGAGALAAAVSRGLSGEQRLQLSLNLPASHHAHHDRGGGTCVVNQLAAAARHALATGVRSVGILDLDAHHGDGTQEIFYTDPAVRTASLHQRNPFFPGTGGAEEQGKGAGAGANLNLPLGLEDSWRDAALAAITWLGDVDVVLVELSADAHWADPVSDLRATDEDFAAVGHALAALGVPVVCELGASLAERAWVGALRGFIRGYSATR
jgi:acetoin utilization deacetylase AcuC-like enzyme